MGHRKTFRVLTEGCSARNGKFLLDPQKFFKLGCFRSLLREIFKSDNTLGFRSQTKSKFSKMTALFKNLGYIIIRRCKKKMLSEVACYKRKLYALLSATNARKKWDTDRISNIVDFEGDIKMVLGMLDNATPEEMYLMYDTIYSEYKEKFPPRVHPHHTAEYRREHYKSQAKYSEEELAQMRVENLRKGYLEFARNPENIAKKSMYFTHLAPMSKDIKRHIELMEGLPKDSPEYKEMDDKLTEMVSTYEEVRENIKRGEY